MLNNEYIMHAAACICNEDATGGIVCRGCYHSQPWEQYVINQIALEEAENTLLDLQGNDYFGRLVGAGIDETGRCWSLVSIISGRSDDSRNRVYVPAEKGAERLVSTALADPMRPAKRPELTIYNTMRDDGRNFVVSNGEQTDRVFSFAAQGKSMEKALEFTNFEDDASSTPRITALCAAGKRKLELSIIRKGDTGRTDRVLYEYPNPDWGVLYCLRTYDYNGEPLPSYRGMPFLLPIRRSAAATAELLWHMLDPQNRVAIAVKFADRQTGELKKSVIINKYKQQVATAA